MTRCYAVASGLIPSNLFVLGISSVLKLDAMLARFAVSNCRRAALVRHGAE